MTMSMMKNENDLIILDTNVMNILNDTISHISIESNNNKKPLLILGPSGVGKDTIINMLLEKYPEIFYKLPSYTTRDIRKGEIDGKDYFFITKEEFKVLKDENKLFGIQEYNNNFYASNKSKLNELIKKGDKIIILNYNIETVNRVKDEFDFNYIAILPPCDDELRNRLKNRGTKPEELEKRMDNSLREKNSIIEANYIKIRVINDEKNKCFRKIEDEIKKLYPLVFRNT
jgi:guanylate kinase